MTISNESMVTPSTATWFGRNALELEAIMRLLFRRLRRELVVVDGGCGLLSPFEIAAHRTTRRVIAIENNERIASWLRGVIENDRALRLADLQEWCRNNQDPNTELRPIPYIHAGLMRLQAAGMLPDGWTYEACTSTSGFTVPRAVAGRIQLHEADVCTTDFFRDAQPVDVVLLSNITSQLLKDGRSPAELLDFYIWVGSLVRRTGYVFFQIGFGQFYDQAGFVGRADSWPLFLSQVSTAGLPPQLIMLTDTLYSSRGGIRGNYDVICGQEAIGMYVRDRIEYIADKADVKIELTTSRIDSWESYFDMLRESDIQVVALSRLPENEWHQALIQRSDLERLLSPTDPAGRQRLLFGRNWRPAQDMIATTLY